MRKACPTPSNEWLYMDNLDIWTSYRLLAVTLQNKWYLEFLETSAGGDLGGAAGNKTWKTKANLKIPLFTVHYLLNALFRLGALGNLYLREVKHGWEASWEKRSVSERRKSYKWAGCRGFDSEMKRVGLCEHTGVSEASQVLVGIGRELLSTTEALSREVETSDL